jgi:hypothetical protein
MDDSKPLTFGNAAIEPGRRRGCELVYAFDKGVEVYSLIQSEGCLVVTTSDGVYILNESGIERVLGR